MNNLLSVRIWLWRQRIGVRFFEFQKIEILQILGKFILFNFVAVVNFEQPAVSMEISPPILNCGKNAKRAEKIACKNHEIIELDKIMRADYISMMSSEIGVDAKNEIMKNQKAWIFSRNKCTDEICIKTSYKRRIGEICSYPVLLGVYPNCKIID